MADSAIPIILFLAFLFVSLTLILGLGLMNAQEERAEAADGLDAGSGIMMRTGVLGDGGSAPSERGARHVAFAKTGADGAATTVDEVVAHLEEFVRGEAAAVAAFAAAPSIGGLLGNAGADDDEAGSAAAGDGFEARPC